MSELTSAVGERLLKKNQEGQNFIKNGNNCIVDFESIRTLIKIMDYKSDFLFNKSEHYQKT